MPFIRSGKNAERQRKQEARELMIDRAISAMLVAITGPRRCLQMCVLAERILTRVLPGHSFSLRLGSLRVYPVDETIDPIAFDPRNTEGIDAGFHAWLEDRNGQLLDPSVLPTLEAEGYGVEGDSYLLNHSRKFVFSELRMFYEELPELELLGLEESEPHLAALFDWTMGADPPAAPGILYLDVGWRGAVPPRGSRI